MINGIYVGPRRWGSGFWGCLLVMAAWTGSAAAAIDLSPANPTHTENFDALPTAASGAPPAATPTVVLNHWYATTNYTTPTSSSLLVSDGTSQTGGIYSFGTTSIAERALGTLRGSAATFPAVATVIQNVGDVTLFDLTISFYGEWWRRGNNAGIDTWSFGYSTAATSIFSTGWTPVTALNYVLPAWSGSGTALDGNSNRTFIEHTLTGLNLAPGQSLWIRWTDGDASGSDHGMALDDFTVSATFASVPEPAGALVAILLGFTLLTRRRASAV